MAAITQTQVDHMAGLLKQRQTLGQMYQLFTEEGEKLDILGPDLEHIIVLMGRTGKRYLDRIEPLRQAVQEIIVELINERRVQIDDEIVEAGGKFHSPANKVFPVFTIPAPAPGLYQRREMLARGDEPKPAA
jgi:hypothetical protein